MAIIANVRPGRWAAGLCVLTALLFPGAARAEGTGTTPTITVQGTDTDQTAARWDLWGTLTYSATPTSYFTTVYSWGTDSAAIYFNPRPYIGTMFEYADAPVYHRTVIFYNPGSPSIWWESCEPSRMLRDTLAPTVRNVARYTPTPGTREGNITIDTRYKVQSGPVDAISSAQSVEFLLDKSK